MSSIISFRRIYYSVPRALFDSSGVPSTCCNQSERECCKLGSDLGLELGCVLGDEFGECLDEVGGWKESICW